jgi:hypothetical protein
MRPEKESTVSAKNPKGRVHLEKQTNIGLP